MTYGHWAGPSPSAQGLSAVCWRGINVWGGMSHAVREATSGDNCEEAFVLSLQLTSELIQPFLAPGHGERTGDNLGVLWAVLMSCQT